MKKLTLLIVGGLGYVLGARAGRQRYEQLRSMATRVKSNPTVQQTAAQAAEAARSAAPVVKDKVAGVAGKVGSQSSDSEETTGANGVPMEGSAYPNGMTPPTS